MAEIYNNLEVKDAKIEKIFKSEPKRDVIQVLLTQSMTLVTEDV